MENIKVNPTHYIKEGKKYERITTILDYFTPKPLVEWQIKNKDAKKISKVAKSIGTRVHNLTLMYDKGKPLGLTPNDSQGVRNCMEAYKRFRDIEKPAYVASEYTMFNEDHMVAGTMDRKMVDGIVLDIKTSEKIRLGYWIQLAVYNWLDNESSDRLAVVRLDKLMGEYEYRIIPYDKRLVNLFLGLLDYYRFMNCGKKEKEEGNGEGITYGKITNRLGLQEAKVCNSWKTWYREI